MTHGEYAEKLFRDGYNCSQAVLLAFSDVTGLDDETAAKLALSCGGGFGRMREICGAVSGAGMVLGLVCGFSEPNNHEQKSKQYKRVQEFSRQFREKNGSIICRELLKGTGSENGLTPEKRTESYYKKRPCPEIVRTSAEILEKMLADIDLTYFVISSIIYIGITPS